MATAHSLDDYCFKQKKRTPTDNKPTVRKDLKQPVHTRDHSLEEIQFLTAFDLDYTYGPAIGMSRSERWERAHSLGLNPDPRVKLLIQQHSEDPLYTQCLWKGSLVSQ